MIIRLRVTSSFLREWMDPWMNVCSGSIVVTTLDPEVPGSGPEWVLIFYEARSTAQGLPEPSSLRGSTLGTSPVEHQDSDWV